MKRFIVGFLAIVGLLAILGAMVVAAIGVLSMLGTKSVPRRTIVEIDFERPIVEYIPGDPVSELVLAQAMSVRDIMDALERAAEDDHVVAVFARIGGGGMGLGQIQEIRDAVLAFRESGKPAVAYADTFGEFGPGNGGYYLATAFDSIYLQPSGDVGLTGLMYQSIFLRGTYDKLGIEPQLGQRYEYKNAMNMYTEKAFTEPHREALEAVMDSQFGQIVRGVAEARSMEPQEVRDLIDRGPYLGREALDAGLVDGLAYRDEALELIREDLPEGSELLYLPKYLERAGRPHRRGKTVALIYGVGAVIRGKGGFDPFSGSFTLGSDDVAAAIRSAVDDPAVRAIVFRVDSPGGSYVGSDTVWRETVRARDVGKPVIVSMGNLAASGGYFVSMAADKIVTQPGTITGSIGVLGGKLVVSGLTDKLGLSFDEVQTSDNASMWNAMEEYSPSQRARLDSWLDRVYEDFTAKVARWRDLELERVLEIARGRIWSGEDAHALGLVDELGGLPRAIEIAKEAAGIPDEDDVRIKIFPRPKKGLEAFFGEGPDSSEDRVAALLGTALSRLQPAVRVLRRIGGEPARGALSMPEVEPVH